ncbi:MAG: TRAP transporter small permease subunit [Alphaproteobacteria bacterium]|nr:TRAP transporter small permease subunit [Alphaproteobacteria bacterium]
MNRALLARFDRALALAALLLLVALLVVVTLGVITRAAGDPLVWTDEVSRFLMIWLACAGWMLASRKRGHIRIRYFANMLPALPKRWVEFVLQAAVVLFGALVARHGWTLLLRNFDLEATTVPVPMAVMYLPILLAGALTAVQAAAECAETLRGPR